MDVLRWLRSSRITRREADHLLDRSPAGDEHSGLADLLAAAGAPARSDELAGERAAMAAFRREYRSAEPGTSAPGTAPAPGAASAAGAASGSVAGRRGSAARRPATRPSGTRRPGPRRAPGRGVVIAALATVVALVGGTAYAAGAGRLPDPVQRQLHEALAGVGVPPPDPRHTPTRTPASASPPAPSGSSPADARLLGLCRAWQAARAPGAPQPRPDDRRALAEAAGGQHRIEAFCAALVATTPSPSTPATPAPATTTPGRPGDPNPGGPPATPPGQEKKGTRK